MTGSRVPASRWAGLGYAVFSALAFGGAGIAGKRLIEAGVDPMHVAWLRASGAALLMLPFVWRYRSTAARHLLPLLGFGLFAITGVHVLYFEAVARVPVAVAVLVEYCAPVLLLLWVRFVQRRPVSRLAVWGVGMCMGGLGLFLEIWRGWQVDLVGFLFAAGSACCMVGYFVLADHGSDDSEESVPPVGVVAYGLLFGSLAMALFVRPWTVSGRALGSRVPLGSTEVPAWYFAVWLVVVATVLAYLAGVAAIRILTPQVAGVIAYLDAVMAAVLAQQLLGESLALPQYVGGALLLAGVYLAQRSGGRREAHRGPVPPGLDGMNDS